MTKIEIRKLGPSSEHLKTVNDPAILSLEEADSIYINDEVYVVKAKNAHIRTGEPISYTIWVS